MVFAIIFFVLLLVLMIVLNKVTVWFQENKNINIIPAMLIDMIAESIFIFNYGSENEKGIIWICVAITIAFMVIVFNLIKYGFKDGILASFAELIFSVVTVFFIACIFIASSKKSKRKGKK